MFHHLERPKSAHIFSSRSRAPVIEVQHGFRMISRHPDVRTLDVALNFSRFAIEVVSRSKSQIFDEIVSSYFHVPTFLAALSRTLPSARQLKQQVVSVFVESNNEEHAFRGSLEVSGRWQLDPDFVRKVHESVPDPFTDHYSLFGNLEVLLDGLEPEMRANFSSDLDSKLVQCVSRSARKRLIEGLESMRQEHTVGLEVAHEQLSRVFNEIIRVFPDVEEITPNISKVLFVLENATFSRLGLFDNNRPSSARLNKDAEKDHESTQRTRELMTDQLLKDPSATFSMNLNAKEEVLASANASSGLSGHQEMHFDSTQVHENENNDEMDDGLFSHGRIGVQLMCNSDGSTYARDFSSPAASEVTALKRPRRRPKRAGSTGPSDATNSASKDQSCLTSQSPGNCPIPKMSPSPHLSQNPRNASNRSGEERTEFSHLPSYHSFAVDTGSRSASHNRSPAAVTGDTVTPKKDLEHRREPTRPPFQNSQRKESTEGSPKEQHVSEKKAIPNVQPSSSFGVRNLPSSCRESKSQKMHDGENLPDQMPKVQCYLSSSAMSTMSVRQLRLHLEKITAERCTIKSKAESILEGMGAELQEQLEALQQESVYSNTNENNTRQKHLRQAFAEREYQTQRILEDRMQEIDEQEENIHRSLKLNGYASFTDARNKQGPGVPKKQRPASAMGNVDSPPPDFNYNPRSRVNISGMFPDFRTKEGTPGKDSDQSKTQSMSEEVPRPRKCSSPPRAEAFLPRRHDNQNPGRLFGTEFRGTALPNDNSAKEVLITSLVKHKPWLLRGRLANWNHQELSSRFEAAREISMNDDVKAELDFIATNVAPNLDRPHSTKSDLQLSFEARFFAENTDTILSLFKSRNFYERLGLISSSQPSGLEIKKGFHKMALCWHPDNVRKIYKHCFANRTAFEELITDVFLCIDEAYRCLSDAGSRYLYDSRIKKRPQGPLRRY